MKTNKLLCPNCGLELCDWVTKEDLPKVEKICKWWDSMGMHFNQGNRPNESEN